MPETFKLENKAVLAVSDLRTRKKAFKQISRLAKKNKLKVANMPMLIQALGTTQEIRDKIRPWNPDREDPNFRPDVWVDTLTSEYAGRRDGTPYYEVWHSVGSHARGEEHYLSYVPGEFSHEYHMNRGFPLKTKCHKKTGYEWINVGQGKFAGQDVIRLPLEAIKNDEAPSAETPFVCYAKGYRKPEKEALKYDDFMKSDRVLMITGSLENREILGKLLFSPKDKGGDGLQGIFLRDFFFDDYFLQWDTYDHIATCLEVILGGHREFEEFSQRRDLEYRRIFSNKEHYVKPGKELHDGYYTRFVAIGDGLKELPSELPEL